jgi:hypothetical protein
MHAPLTRSAPESSPRLRTRRLLARLAGDSRHTEAMIGGLPAYQVALWPDGWQLEPDGSVRVCDTHEMAEARRWHAMAARNGRGQGQRMRATQIAGAMGLHGLTVPRAVIELSGHRFPSEQVASVALMLVAGDWIGERRRRLAMAPDRALAERRLAWCGSRHGGAPDAPAVAALLDGLLSECIDEGLIPNARYRLATRGEDAYGIRCCRCVVEVTLDPYACARVQEVLAIALIPWNRAVVRNARAVPLIAVQVRSRAGASRTGAAGAAPATRQRRAARC